jgi:hypothetical protein
MKVFLKVKGLIFLGLLSACGYEPVGRWEATKQVEVYQKNDHPLTVAFVVEKGEICAISERLFIRKDLAYKQVSCAKGRGWIADLYFKKISD